MRYFCSKAGLALACFLAVGQLVRADDAAVLAKLRADIGTSYGSAQAHCALAKYHFDRGNHILAFYILNDARTRITPPSEFGSAFSSIFRNRPAPDTSPEAEAALLAQLKKAVNNAAVLQKLADLYEARADRRREEEYLRRVVRLRPHDFATLNRLSMLLSSDDRENESQQLIDAFIRSNPESAQAVTRRINALISKRDWLAARSLAESAKKKFAADSECRLQLYLILESLEDHAAAARELEGAAENAPDDVRVQALAGQYFLKRTRDESKALKYYLRAYFLEPDNRGPQLVEPNVKSVILDVSALEYEKLANDDTPFERLMEHPNPVIVGWTIRSIEANWAKKQEHWDTKRAVPFLLNAMLHDDPNLRWQATAVLMKNADSSFDPQLKQLLVDQDLRRRGLALYIAGRRWKEDGIKYLTANLNEPAVLLRFDAISALIQEGGEKGKQLAIEYAKSGREQNQFLQRVLEGVLEADKAPATPDSSEGR